ncbi:ferrochelatase [Roseiconus lacunae]|uniref:Ferrochelatase n=1 Tax=Roseiconus lacunae TaxID=2605694 RepID=A0ABT7PPY5_9BACT|nr:ferrochelatase [Roseiconus lacunae]MCD0461857.1 ferrochelatase [Roseiconus lacunae]MDM4018568.1 ferrochelatase [Roseiconus lacunae]
MNSPSSSDHEPPYDSFLLVSFGGPEGPDDVMPFLENVLRGKNVPRERMLEVSEHYKSFGGVSPINEQNRQLIDAIRAEFAQHGIDLPIYWGNRNWHPLLPDTLRQMKADGRRRAIAFFTSMFSSYSGCRQYRENIAAAQQEVGEDAPIVEKVRMGFNHPGFIEAVADGLRQSIETLGCAADQATVLFTAHSIPMGMADNCDYVRQLEEACRIVAEQVGATDWKLVYQSRSGPPQQPWLEPDICDEIEAIDDRKKLTHLAVVPIGFISDHMEVLYDLDDEAAELCDKRGIVMSRAATAGVHPGFVSMIRELVQERLGMTTTKQALGTLGPWHDVCPQNCCTYTPRRPVR